MKSATITQTAPGMFSVKLSYGFFSRKIEYHGRRFVDAASIANGFLTNKPCTVSPVSREGNKTTWNITVYEPNDITAV